MGTIHTKFLPTDKILDLNKYLSLPFLLTSISTSHHTRYYEFCCITFDQYLYHLSQQPEIMEMPIWGFVVMILAGAVVFGGIPIIFQCYKMRRGELYKYPQM